jgi:hypothetical protein
MSQNSRRSRSAQRSLADDIEPMGVMYFLLANSRKIFILSLLIGSFGWIATNALFLQKGHHPAPLFVPPLAQVDPSNQALIASPPLPAARPSESDHSEIAKPNKPAAPLASAPLTPPSAAPAPIKSAARDELNTGGKDPIAHLLSQQDENNEARIRAAQRALIKLGYVLRDNGILGPTTEQAIEIYERRNNLPITGTLSKQVIDMMARQSGLSIP